MTHSYKVSNMTCSGCLTNVKSRLLMHPDVLSAEVELPDNAIITMQNHISLTQLQDAIGRDSKYRISVNATDASHSTMHSRGTLNWFKTYKPLLLIFIFTSGVSTLSASAAGSFNGMIWMQYFMAGFFITFSFFKLLDLKGFAESYAMYDILAKKLPVYGYIYPFIELLLGIAYLSSFNMLITNAVTVVVMGFSSIGVIQSVLNKKRIQCACLGAVFNLPMSTVTIIEDLLMIVMAFVMIIN
ncbi:MAG: cation transporter [Bacteroidetes bacterium]|jgi:cation transport ATPase|nr:cation transporter [Bacteroidota bacterium]MBP8915604.1 cation transporter [Chitinophagales bacterium]MBP9189738.1 cation transporter [Chitinophagales bacterium]MBP9794598.1 cation transporter [Chitinophagales bacterium]